MIIKNENPLKDNAAKQRDVLSLAFIGDAIHTLYVREKVAGMGDYSAFSLHKMSSKFCSAQTQAKVFDENLDFFTEDELEIARRARNHKLGHCPKNCPLDIYKKATSFEAILGYLYLVSNQTRLEKLLEKSTEQM